MSGVSDLAMRRIARRFGAALVFSEMVAAETFLQGDAEASMRAEGEGLAPHAVQLVGREARALAETARRVVDAGAALVDINMGCPSRRVSGALAGAALMRDLDQRRTSHSRGGRGGVGSRDRQDALGLGRDVA